MIIDLCKSQLKYILKLLKFDQDKKALYKEIMSDPEYKRLSFRAGRAVGFLLGSSKLEKYLEENGKEKVDMCKALDDLWQDALEEGKIEGKIKDKKEGKIRTIIQMIIKKILKNKTPEEIADEIYQRLIV